jgi:hypothetical protein
LSDHLSFFCLLGLIKKSGEFIFNFLWVSRILGGFLEFFFFQNFVETFTQNFPQTIT